MVFGLLQNGCIIFSLFGGLNVGKENTDVSRGVCINNSVLMVSLMLNFCLTVYFIIDFTISRNIHYA